MHNNVRREDKNRLLLTGYPIPVTVLTTDPLPSFSSDAGSSALETATLSAEHVSGTPRRAFFQVRGTGDISSTLAR
eukprot:766107-Hanusia_phi.AAC.2